MFERETFYTASAFMHPDPLRKLAMLESRTSGRTLLWQKEMWWASSFGEGSFDEFQWLGLEISKDGRLT